MWLLFTFLPESFGDDVLHGFLLTAVAVYLWAPTLIERTELPPGLSRGITPDRESGNR